MIISNVVHQPVREQVARFVETLDARPATLNQQLRETLNRQRVRMANLEQALGRTSDEKHTLMQAQRELGSQLLKLTAEAHLANQQLAAERQRTADLEARLASYRRQAAADQREIEMLKDQLFA